MRNAERSTVILVDDQADIRLLLATRLSLEPDLLVVGEGANGAEALQLARQHNPNALVLDLQMPGMTGSEVIPILRGMSPASRIVVFSGHIDAHSELAGWAKPDALVEKGEELGVLVRELQRVLASRPEDVVTIDAGRIPIPEAISAFDSWVGLNTRIRELAARDAPMSVEQQSGARVADLLALVGLLLRIGQVLVAADHGSDLDLRFDIRRDAGQAARRALISIQQGGVERFYRAWNHQVRPDSFASLELLGNRLVEGLPAG